MRRMLYCALNLLVAAALLLALVPVAAAQPAPEPLAAAEPASDRAGVLPIRQLYPGRAYYGPLEPRPPLPAPQQGTALAITQERILVLLVEFPDLAHGHLPPLGGSNRSRYLPASVDRDHYEDLFFNDPKSLRNYFLQNSYDQFQLLTVSGGSYILDWGRITTTYPAAIYGNDDARFGDDLGADPGTTLTYDDFAREVIAQAAIALGGGFPYASFDRAGSSPGIDHLVIVHAGRGQESMEELDPDGVDANHLYSRVGTLSGVSLGGVPVNSYIIAPEDATVGLLAKLLAEQMGAQATANTNTRYPAASDGTNESPAAFWDLMADGWKLGYWVGTSPANLNIWQRLRLGFIRPEEIPTYTVYDTPRNVVLGRIEERTLDSKALRISLPDYSPNRPHSGASYWWTGKEPDQTDTLERDLDLTGATSASLDFYTWYDTEASLAHTDAATIELGGGGTTYQWSVGGQSNGWEHQVYDLKTLFPSATTVHLRFTYTTDADKTGEGWFLDDFTLTRNGVVAWHDDAESLDPGWNGGTTWRRTAPPTYHHYYLAEWRSQSGFDYGYYRGVFYMTNQATGEAEHFTYNPGLVVWYVNERWAPGENYTGFRPGEGFLLPVDSHPSPLVAGGVPWRPRVQMCDAPFNKDGTTGQSLLGQALGPLPAQPTFYDASTPAGTYPYWNPADPDNSVKTPRYGVKLVVEDHAPDMSWGKLGFSIDAGRFDTSSKSANPSPTVDAGTQLTYTVVIRNTNADAFGVTMADPVPANTTYVPGSVAASSGTASESGGQINWSGMVAVGVPVTVTFRVTVNTPLANGTVIVNTANIYEGGILKASPSCTVTVRSWPDLRASYKICSPKTVRADDPFTNTIVLHNVGTDHALAVDVTDSVPANTTYVAGSATATAGSVAFDSGGNRVVWNGQVNVGQDVTVTFRLRVNPYTTPRVITNTAMINDHRMQPFPVSDSVTVIAAPNFDRAAKTVVPLVASPGSILTYTVAITNTGNIAGPVYFTDTIPVNTTYVGVTNATWYPGDNQIRWSGALSPAAQRTITLRVRVVSPLPNGTVITNTALINNLVRQAFTTIQSAPDLYRSVKTVLATSAASGGVLTYTITLTNTGTADAPMVCITDPIPVNTAYIPGTLQYPVGSGGYSAGVITWCGPVYVGRPVNITFQVLITLPPTATAIITNTVTINDGVHAPFTRSVSTPIAMIWLECPAGSPFSGELLNVNVRLSNVRDLHGVELYVRYPTSTLQMESIIDGSWFVPVLWGPGCRGWDPVAGIVTLKPTLSSETGISGSGVLVTLRFRARDGGVVTPTITGAILSQAPDPRQIIPIPYNTRLCPITVTGRYVEGYVTLQGRTLYTDTLVTVDGVEVARSNGAGYYRFYTPRPTFVVKLSKPGYLWTQRTVPEQLTTLITLPTVNLRGGDVIGGSGVLITRDPSCVVPPTPASDTIPGPPDGTVNLQDLIFVANKAETFVNRSSPFWGPDPCYHRHSADPDDPLNFDIAYRADINDDGYVNIHDLVAVGYNWYRTAPTTWP